MNGFPGRASPRGKYGRGHHTAIVDASPASMPFQRRPGRQVIDEILGAKPKITKP
jgi:hypothetical protein